MAKSTKKRAKRAAKRLERTARAAKARPLGPSWHDLDVDRPPDDGLDGGAGVREPRKPLPSAPHDAIALDEPDPVRLDLAALSR